MDWCNWLYLVLGYVNSYAYLRKLGVLDMNRDEYKSHGTRWTGRVYNWGREKEG